mmetsp:Transcript_20472/g.43400  ORF Transcript_20472/g.43400 Transcript_20472/m.43400 type:complete len:86 (+) Transcript_20472:172-429(+)
MIPQGQRKICESSSDDTFTLGFGVSIETRNPKLNNDPPPPNNNHRVEQVERHHRNDSDGSLHCEKRNSPGSVPGTATAETKDSPW